VIECENERHSKEINFLFHKTMNITWHGNSLVRVTTQKDKNNSVEVVIDPFSKETGIKPTKTKADILLVSNQKALDSVDNVSGDFFLISSPGEYEVKDVFVHALRHDQDKLIFIIEAEDIILCYLGEIKNKELNAQELEEIGNVDILVIPTGGQSTINSKEAAQIMAQIEPRIVVPINYKIPGIKEKKESVEEFLKIAGASSKEKVPKLSIKKKDISLEGERQIIVLDCK
jgi:L-ascorbate metabolism protein UlaG (beta-lactamase superfamily)